MTVFSKSVPTQTAFVVAALLGTHLLAAWFSVGMWHPDEHFQTIEFAFQKQFGTPVDRMAWEFGDQIRPWLQPALYYSVIGGLKVLGLEQPHLLVLAMRIASAVIGVSALLSFALPLGLTQVAPQRRLLLFALPTLLFFLPVLHARTSSENLSSSLFLIGLNILIYLVLRSPREERSEAVLGFVSGLLLGLASVTRFQTGVMLVGLAAWVFVYHRAARRRLVFGMLGVAAALTIMVLTDRWGYGTWVFTAWNYFRANIVDGVAATYGVSPFYYYLLPSTILDHGTAFAGVLLPVIVVGWFVFPRHAATWCTLPFLAVHCLIGHKESRFLLPMLVVGLWYLPLILERLWGFFGGRGRAVLGTTLGLNLLLLVGLAVAPAQPRGALQLYLAKHLPGTVLYNVGPPLWEPWNLKLHDTIFDTAAAAYHRETTVDAVEQIIQTGEATIVSASTDVERLAADERYVLEYRASAVVRALAWQTDWHVFSFRGAFDAPGRLP